MVLPSSKTMYVFEQVVRIVVEDLKPKKASINVRESKALSKMM